MLKIIIRLSIYLIVSVCLVSCDEFIWNRDSHIVFYGSSNIFMDGDKGRTSGTGWIGQYRLMIGGGSGGCCPSSASFPYKGKPKGEILAHWQVLYNNPDFSRFYYAYHPNPEINIPPKVPGHEWYIIFYSFGQLGLRASALTKEQMNAPNFDVLPGLTEYQIGLTHVFYYKVYSDDKNLEFKTITSTPFNHYSKIEGIEVTKEQYEYIIENNNLDKNSPNLTSEQKTYIEEREKMKVEF